MPLTPIGTCLVHPWRGPPAGGGGGASAAPGLVSWLACSGSNFLYCRSNFLYYGSIFLYYRNIILTAEAIFFTAEAIFFTVAVAVAAAVAVAVAVAVVVAVAVGKTSVQKHSKNCASVKRCAQNKVFFFLRLSDERRNANLSQPECASQAIVKTDIFARMFCSCRFWPSSHPPQTLTKTVLFCVISWKVVKHSVFCFASEGNSDFVGPLSSGPCGEQFS